MSLSPLSSDEERSGEGSGSSEEEEEMDMERELNHLLRAIPEQRVMRMHADDEADTLRAKQL